MAIKFNRSQTFATNGTVTAAGLHNLIDGTDIYQALITDQPSLTAVAPEDSILIADASLTAGDAPRQTTVSNLFDDALTGGTYTNLNLTGALTFGTATGNRTVSTSATITTGTIPSLTSSTASITIGTIPTLTAGTTTSTAANITNGTIQTLTSSTATITGGTFGGLLNSSTGTFSGAINSTSGTISNFSTTLAGDFSISQGTGTLGTTGVTSGTYGTSSVAVTLGVDSKGRITTVSTSEISSSGPAFLATRSTSDQSINSSVYTKIQFNNEVFDTNSCFDNSTNYRFTPNKSGYYYFFATSVNNIGSGSQTYTILKIYKNGNDLSGAESSFTATSGGGSTLHCFTIGSMNGTTDYVEAFAYNIGTNPSVQQRSSFGGYFIRP